MLARSKRCSLTLCLLLLALALPAPVTQAQSRLEAERDRLDYRFAERLDFDLEARLPEAPVEVILRYQIGAESPINRRIPEIQVSGDTLLSAHHRESLVRGQIPPASEIRWWWSLELAGGEQIQTEPRSRIYLDQRFDWQSLESEDLRIWWYDADPSFAGDVERAARRSLTALEALFGSTPDRRIEIVTYQSQADLRPALVDRGATYEARLATLGARVADDILVLDAGTRSQERDEVLAHELSHIVLNLQLEEAYVDAPLWLDEGLAMYIEGPLDREEQAALDRAIDEDRLMSVRSMSSFPGDASLVLLAYAQSQDLIQYLVETHGLDALRELLEHIGSGEMSPDTALETVYGIDQLGLYQAYREARGLPPAEPATAATIEPRGGPAIGARDEGLPPICASVVLVLPALAWLLRRQLLLA